MKNKELVTIGKFKRLLDAYSVASRIESEGIECFLPGVIRTKSTHNNFIGTSQIKLQVRKGDVPETLRILKDKLLDTFFDLSIHSDTEM